MAILKGKDGTVTLDGDDLTATGTGVVQSWNVSIETDTLETTSMGTGGWKTFEGSLQSWTGTVEMYFRDDNGNLADGTWFDGAAVVVALTDGTSGNTYGGSAIVTSIAVDVSTADLVTLSLDLTGTGELAIS
jgi:predicted secreted protein